MRAKILVCLLSSCVLLSYSFLHCDSNSANVHQLFQSFTTVLRAHIGLYFQVAILCPKKLIPEGDA